MPAGVGGTLQEGIRARARACARVLELADELDDDALRVEALDMLTFLGSAVGDPEAPAYAARAHDLATARRPAAGAGGDWPRGRVRARRHRRGRALLESEYGELRERDELSAAEVLRSLAWVELWARPLGARGRARRACARHHLQYGLEVPWTICRSLRSPPTAASSSLRATHSERALQLGEEQFGLHHARHLGTLGHRRALERRPADGGRWFAEAEAADEARLARAGRRWWTADHVEALLDARPVDDAVRVLDAWEAERSDSAATGCSRT